MSNLSELIVTKTSGAGNTFSIVDARQNSIWMQLEKRNSFNRSEIARKICNSVTGLKTDGIIFIQDATSECDFTWDFYNSDGSTAEMCGNAARCAAVYCAKLENRFSNLPIRFKTGAGVVEARLKAPTKVQVQMPPVRIENNNLQLRSHSSALENFVFVNTGVPHLVQKIHTVADLPNLKELAKEMRSHSDLGVSGSNVTFYQEQTLGKIKASTFERGVEDYTLACGTGAVAAAKAYQLEHSVQNIEVEMPGGKLQVDFGSNDSSPTMTGEALIIGEFKYNIEVLK